MNAKPLNPKEFAGFLALFAWGIGVDSIMVATDALRWLRRKLFA